MQQLQSLNKAEYAELNAHPLNAGAGTPLSEKEADIGYYETILKNLGESDPAYNHMSKRLQESKRYFELLERFEKAGVGKV